MTQPKAIYSSIPINHPYQPHWLSTPPNLLPVSIASPHQSWPYLNWSVGKGNYPQEHSEIPGFLWLETAADINDGSPKQFTRRFVVSDRFSATTILKGKYRLVLSIAADDIYEVRICHGPAEMPNLLMENPNPGFNFGTPAVNSWRNVKTYLYGEQSDGIVLNEGEVLDIQVVVQNIVSPNDSSLVENPAMFTWVMQIFSID